MAGVVISLSQADWLKGPAHVFADVAVPAAGAKMTLTTDTTSGWKTPDATENPNAIYVGCVNDLKHTSSQEVTKEYCDNQSNPILILPGQTSHTFELMLKAIFSATIMAKLFGITSQTITSSTKNQFGSVSTFPSMAIAIVGKMVNDPTKYWYQMFYSCRQVNAFSVDAYKINQLGKIAAKFEAAALAGRAEGVDVGEFVHTI